MVDYSKLIGLLEMENFFLTGDLSDTSTEHQFRTMRDIPLFLQS